MPIFEFRCAACGARYSMLIGMVAGATEAPCPKCDAVAGDKLVSKPARFRSEDGRIDEIADRLESIDELGPATEMRGLMREMGHAMDDDAADDMEEMFEADMEGKLEDD